MYVCVWRGGVSIHVFLFEDKFIKVFVLESGVDLCCAPTPPSHPLQSPFNQTDIWITLSVAEREKGLIAVKQTTR